MSLNNKISKLFLLPNTLSYQDNDHWQLVFPQKVRDTITNLNLIFAETPKRARNLIKALGSTKLIQQIDIYPLDHETNESMLEKYIDLVKIRKNAGILSDAGCVAVADPGSIFIRKAHAQSIQIIPLVGPSSILLALIASGLNGQRFAFNGYLPKKNFEREKTILELQKRSNQHNETQIFIETPYRNEVLFQAFLKKLDLTTILSIAIDLTMPKETIVSKTIADWRQSNLSGSIPLLKNRQAIFLFLATKNSIKNNW